MKKSLYSLFVLSMLSSCTTETSIEKTNQTTNVEIGKSNREVYFQTMSKWMGEINPNTEIGKLTIPGTHDSMSINNHAFSSNQYGSIKEQLEAGARIFDLRFNLVNGQFMGYHGVVKLNITLDEIMTDFSNFLRENPTEVIIATFKKENNKDAKESWVNYFNQQMTKFEANGLVKTNWNSNSKLNDCRGKILPLSRETYTNTTFVQGWSGNPNYSKANLIGDGQYNNLNISDYYHVSTILAASINYKFEKIRENIDRANTNNAVDQSYLTYCSGASAFAYPVAVADRMNPRVAEYIQKSNLKSGGWIMMDFINSEKGKNLSKNCINVSLKNYVK